jgi:predicted ATPase
VLVLDDLQWADNATLELVPILASALVQERLLIVGTYRNDELGLLEEYAIALKKIR